MKQYCKMHAKINQNYKYMEEVEILFYIVNKTLLFIYKNAHFSCVKTIFHGIPVNI